MKPTCRPKRRLHVNATRRCAEDRDFPPTEPHTFPVHRFSSRAHTHTHCSHPLLKGISMLRSTFLTARRFRAFPMPATLLTAALAFGAAPLQAATYTWSGNSTVNAFWGTGSNWIGNTAPPTGNDLVFTGNNRATNGPAAAYTATSLTFDSGATAFSLIGQNGSSRTLTMSGPITNNSTNTQTFGTPNGSTTLNVAFGSGTTRAINDTAGSIVFYGGLQGTNVTLNKTGPNTVTIGNSPTVNSISGTFNVNAGTLDVQRTTNMTVNVATGATLDVSNSAQTVNLTAITTSGTVLIDAPTALGSGAFVMSGSTSYLDVNSSLNAGSVALAGTVVLEGAVTSSGSLTFAPGMSTTFTLGDTTNGSVTYAGPTAFAGDLVANITSNYPDASFDSPSVFPMFTDLNGLGSTTSFTSITVNYDGQNLSLAQSSDPNVWISTDFNNSVSGLPQYVTFNNITGQLVVVPEPTGVMIAGIGVAMAGWQVARKRRSVLKGRADAAG